MVTHSNPDPATIEGFSSALIDMCDDYVRSALGVLTPIPDRVIVVQPGAGVTWDENCQGQLWARVRSVTPGEGPGRGTGPCGIPFWDIELELGIIRCVAGMDNRGRPPKDHVIAEDGKDAVGDMSALLGVLTCSPYTREVINWTPLGPEGGFAGGAWRFQVEMNNCIQCLN